MISLKVTFADGNVIHTQMNATIDDARAYYVDNFFNFGDTSLHPNDNLVKAVSVDLIPTSEGSENATV